MQAERKRSFYRALILGALLIPINLYWLMHAESLHPAVYSTLFTLFYNVTFSIFVLVLLNALLKKAAPQIAFQPSELLIVYVMLSIGTGIFGHDLMNVMVPTLTSLWGATPENEWAVLFGRHIPQWLTVYDERALIAFQKGGNYALHRQEFERVVTSRGVLERILGRTPLRSAVYERYH